jgi:hypothetical protein
MKQERLILNYIIWINTRPSQSINNIVVHTAVFCCNETDYNVPIFTAANYTITIKPM